MHYPGLGGSSRAVIGAAIERENKWKPKDPRFAPGLGNLEKKVCNILNQSTAQDKNVLCIWNSLRCEPLLTTFSWTVFITGFTYSWQPWGLQSRGHRRFPIGTRFPGSGCSRSTGRKRTGRSPGRGRPSGRWPRWFLQLESTTIMTDGFYIWYHIQNCFIKVQPLIFLCQNGFLCPKSNSREPSFFKKVL